MLFKRSAPAPRFPAPSEFGFAELRGGGSRVTIVPSLGGKIAAMEIGGRQWLWTSDVIPFAPPTAGASYVETADSGGYDECFPTVAACRLPSWVKRYGNVELPDHGELWSQQPEIRVETGGDVQRASTTWHGERMPYRFTRTVRIDGDGAVIMEYEAANEGRERLPFVWSSHPLLPLTSDTMLDLPRDARVRVAAHHHIDLGDATTAHHWPVVRHLGRGFDFSRPDTVARRYACKLFVDMPAGLGRAAVMQDGMRLEVAFDSREVPNFGLWLNRRGWTPFPRGKAYQNLAFEPCTGAPDSLTDALGAWNAAHWVEPGERRRWKLTWTARAAGGD
jgi:galactose mutarotase-like enzyme